MAHIFSSDLINANNSTIVKSLAIEFKYKGVVKWML